MKKVPFLITCGIILLITGVYFFYKKYLIKESVKPWDLVPADAILVYEKDNCNSCVDQFSESAFWNIIENAAFYNKFVDDSVRKRLSSSIKNKSGLLISAHATKKDDFDFVYYVPSTEIGTSLLLNAGQDKITSREFNSIKIEELKFPNQTFSLAKIEDVWIGSFTPFLIEDVIRTYKNNNKSDFKKKIIDIQPISSIKDDAGNLFINFKNFSEWLSLFWSGSPTNDFVLGTSSLLDIKANENNIVLNGFSLDSTDHTKYLLSIFSNQSPVPFGLKHLISNRTIALSSYGISDGTSFHSDLKNFVQKRNPSLRDTLNKISASHGVDFGSLYNSISDEFGICFMEPVKGNRLSKIILLETSQPEFWLDTFNKISEKSSVDTIFYEKYSDFEIRDVPIHKFAEKIFWPFVTGFKHNFYTSIGKVILIADNLEELKNFLDDIEAEDTWGKSVIQNQFLESTLLESNMSIYINTLRVWNVLNENLQPRWREFVKDYRLQLQALQMSSIQFSHLNNSYYTNVIFTYRPVSQSLSTVSRERNITNFDRGIYKLHTVKSHVNRGNEVLVQDSINDLSLVSSDGKVLWKLSIGDKIISEVDQIDFFNNGKLQYFFATQDAIHIIDRLGNYVEPYPLYIPKVSIEYISFVDYDNSKKYRFLIAGEDGKLLMFDKDGNNLKGWDPKDVGGSLAMAPRHHRIKSKDYILAIRRDGHIFLMNRRGEDIRKYPLDLEAIPSGAYFLERGSSSNDTYFVIISRDGFRIKFNIEGKIQNRETLLKNSINSNFSLISEKSNKSYLTLQHDGKQLNLADELGKRILTKDFPSLNPADIKYFDFGAGKTFITITDKSNSLSYIFDGQGNLLTTKPLQGTSIEIRPVNSEHFKVFFIHNKSLIIQPL